MAPLKQLLRVTPNFFIFSETFLLILLYVISENMGSDLNIPTIRLMINLAAASLITTLACTHFQIRHTPYLLIQPIRPSEFIRTFLGISLLRSLIIYVSFKNIEVSAFVMLIRNAVLAGHFFTFISFSFSLNSKIQYHSTKNGKLSLNYIIQATLVLACLILIIFASTSPNLRILNLFGIGLIAIFTYIAINILQSLRMFAFYQRKPKLSILSTLLAIYLGFYILSFIRIPSARNPWEVSLWQSFRFSNVALSHNLTRSLDYVNQFEIPCEGFFPPHLVESCRVHIKEKFLNTEFPNTNHPEFEYFVRNDRKILERFAYFYLKSTTVPTQLSPLWLEWLATKADLEQIAKLIKSSDTVATTITTALVKVTPFRPEIAKYLTPEVVSRFADASQVQKTLKIFNGENHTYDTRFEIWKAWEKLSKSEKLVQPTRLPASAPEEMFISK